MYTLEIKFDDKINNYIHGIELVNVDRLPASIQYLCTRYNVAYNSNDLLDTALTLLQVITSLYVAAKRTNQPVSDLYTDLLRTNLFLLVETSVKNGQVKELNGNED